MCIGSLRENWNALEIIHISNGGLLREKECENDSLKNWLTYFSFILLRSLSGSSSGDSIVRVYGNNMKIYHFGFPLFTAPPWADNSDGT